MTKRSKTAKAERESFFDFLERNNEEVMKMPRWVLEAHGIALPPERTTPQNMNLTTSESEIMCLLKAAEAYSLARKTENKPTSIIDTIIARLQSSPKDSDLVFVQRINNKATECTAGDCKSIAVRDGRCLAHLPKDPFV